MAKQKKLIALSLITIATLILVLLIPRLTSNNTQLMPCYHSKNGDSNSLLKIFKQSKDRITGELIFQNYQKDSSYGSFSGQFKDDQLTIDFGFTSEGTESTRPIKLIKENDQLVGEGYKYQAISNCNSILYDQGLGLIPFDMKLPLHLFLQMRLQSIDDEQLSNTFGPGGLKPFKSAKIVYTPMQGEPTNAVVFYLWYKSVWDVIANPNEAPDWGVM
jgi:hypothetical protein